MAQQRTASAPPARDWLNRADTVQRLAAAARSAAAWPLPLSFVCSNTACHPDMSTESSLRGKLVLVTGSTAGVSGNPSRVISAAVTVRLKVVGSRLTFQALARPLRSPLLAWARVWW